MSVLKKCKVVMLPTEKATYDYGDIVQLTVDNHPTGHKKGFLCIHNLPFGSTHVNWKHQHLYITSDEKAQVGDWMLGWQHGINGTPEGGAMHYIRFHDNSSAAKLSAMSVGAYKIIATTNSSLRIPIEILTTIGEAVTDISSPQPSQSFIEIFVREYNKGNIITDVLVEYEDYWIKVAHSLDVGYKPKINPKDNTITIRKVKDSWNREEVIELISKAISNNGEGVTPGSSKQHLINWIEKNL